MCGIARSMEEFRWRRHPEGTVLHQVVKDALPEYRELARAFGRYPGFIEKAFEEYLDCGIPERAGYVLVECEECGHWEKVVCSCGRRGVCPYCAKRRMWEEAAELVEKVLPAVPYRHVVVSYPYGINLKVGFQPKLLTEVEGKVMEEVQRWQRERGLPLVGGVLFRHRFGEDLELFIHCHILMFDGPFRLEPVAFNAQTRHPEVWREVEIEQRDIDELAARVWKRIKGLLARRGIEAGKKSEPVAKPAPPQMELFAAKVGERERGGAAVGPQEEDEVEHPTDGMWARVEGLHVCVSQLIDGADRKNLEKLCRYFLRPSFSLSRLGRRADGKVTYRLRRKDKAGNTVLVMEPVAFLARIANLIPGPRQRTRRLFGMLAPRAAKRKEVMPKVAKKRCNDDRTEKEKAAAAEAIQHRLDWDDLLERTLGVKPLRCPGCGGRMRVIRKAVKIERNAVGRRAIDLSPPARGPPLGEDAPVQTAA